MPDLTRAQAQALAKAAWDRPASGDDPRESVYGHVERDDNGAEYRVGIQSFGGYSVKGWGRSWREACERAGLIQRVVAEAEVKR